MCDKGTVTTDVARVARKLADRHKFPIIVDAKTVTFYVDMTIDVLKLSWDEVRKGLVFGASTQQEQNLYPAYACTKWLKVQCTYQCGVDVPAFVIIAPKSIPTVRTDAHKDWP